MPAPFGDRCGEIGLRQGPALDQGVLERVLDGAGDIGIAQTLRAVGKPQPLDRRTSLDAGDLGLEHRLDFLTRRQRVADDIVKASEQRAVQDGWMIGCCNNNAI